MSARFFPKELNDVTQLSNLLIHTLDPEDVVAAPVTTILVSARHPMACFRHDEDAVRDLIS